MRADLSKEHLCIDVTHLENSDHLMLEVEEFLYMDPDTGIIVCMVADEDGFRPATAAQEIQTLPAHWLFSSEVSMADESRKIQGDEESSLDSFVKSFEHAFLAPCAG